MYRIVKKEMLTPTICRMKVQAPRLAASAQPGQFLIIRADVARKEYAVFVVNFTVDLRIHIVKSGHIDNITEFM